jgi:hypothetical protein
VRRRKATRTRRRETFSIFRCVSEEKRSFALFMWMQNEQFQEIVGRFVVCVTRLLGKLIGVSGKIEKNPLEIREDGGTWKLQEV